MKRRFYLKVSVILMEYKGKRAINFKKEREDNNWKSHGTKKSEELELMAIINGDTEVCKRLLCSFTSLGGVRFDITVLIIYYSTTTYEIQNTGIHI